MRLDLDDPVSTWAAAQLGPRHVELLAGLPHPVTLPVRGFGRVLFCHGSPRDDEEVLLVDTRMQRWQEAFAAVREDVRTVVCGHTHMPFLRLVDRRVVVNPGSVGMPYGGAGAHWALLRDGAVTLRHTTYDVDAASRDICATSSFEGCASGSTTTCARAARTWRRWRPSAPGRSRRRLSRAPGGWRAPRRSPAQPPIADIGRSGWWKSGSPMPWPRGLAPHLALDQGGEVLVGGAVAQRAAQVDLAAGEQAVADLAVGGQPHPVAGGAERRGHAGDDADGGRPAVDEEQLGRGASARRRRASG